MFHWCLCIRCCGYLVHPIRNFIVLCNQIYSFPNTKVKFFVSYNINKQKNCLRCCRPLAKLALGILYLIDLASNWKLLVTGVCLSIWILSISLISVWYCLSIWILYINFQFSDVLFWLWCNIHFLFCNWFMALCSNSYCADSRCTVSNYIKVPCWCY